MPPINFVQVQAILDHFEALVAACEEWRDFLEEHRPASYKGQGPGGVLVNGRFQANRTGPPPPVGTTEHREMAINRKIVQNKGQVEGLLELLEGEVFERLRPIVDRLSTLETALKGDWF
jgi:hypothetical protein